MDLSSSPVESPGRAPIVVMTHGRRAQEEETRESWYGVQDPRKRKQIQDRLAQRARRKRLAEESKNDERALVVRFGPSKRFRAIAPSRCCSDTGSSSTPSATSSTPTPLHPASASTSNSNSPPPTSPEGFLLTPQLPPTSPPTPLPHDQRLIVKPNRSAFIAFAEIGHRMGISWVCVGFVRSWRQPPDLPENLQPTPLQLTTPHPVWIDRLPFPRMRDNVILLANMIDLEAFYVDLLMNESFEVKEGMPPHDPAAYRIVPEFKAKWGYLFH